MLYMCIFLLCAIFCMYMCILLFAFSGFSFVAFFFQYFDTVGSLVGSFDL